MDRLNAIRLFADGKVRHFDPGDIEGIEAWKKAHGIGEMREPNRLFPNDDSPYSKLMKMVGVRAEMKMLESMKNREIESGSDPAEVELLRDVVQALIYAHFYRRKLKAVDFDNIRSLTRYGITTNQPPKDYLISSDSKNTEYHDIINQLAHKVNNGDVTTDQITQALNTYKG